MTGTRRNILISLAIMAFLIGATIIVVYYGKGYRFGFDKGKLEFAGTGLFVATSNPDGAEVFVNGHLTTATDSTVNLAPGEYDIKISKEGYFSWQKKIKVQKEVVTKVNALLFPITPKLEGITAIGIDRPIIDPSQTRLAYTVASQAARKNGIYVVDMTSKPILTLQSASNQIADDTIDNFSLSRLSWSPDGKEILASISATPDSNSATTYLLSANGFNQTPRDVTTTLTQTQSTWLREKQEKENSRLATLKAELKQTIQQNFSILAWSYDDSKILYQASQSATIPIIINPRLIGTNSTEDARDIKKDSLYVYDIKEDRNYKINASLSPSYQISDVNRLSVHYPINWFPDSSHLIYVHEKKIDIMDYDGINATTIYAGPFLDNYVFPWASGEKLVILTDLGNPQITPNLYTISLR